MPASNPSATASQSPDLQQLVGLLGSLMPLLLRFQSQVQMPPFQVPPFQMSPFQMSPFQMPPFQGGLGGVVPNPVIEHQAAINLVSDITADALRNLSAYLEAHANQHAGLDSCVPIVTQAARSFAARDYARAFDLIWQTYRAIAEIRSADPRVPPLRSPEQAASDQASSVH